MFVLCRTEPPSLEGALSAIRDVKEAAVAHSNQPQQQQQAGEAAAPSGAPGDSASNSLTVTAADLSSPPELSAAADAALKHLLLYVDVEQLYQAALGLYDLPLAFMVVSHSQKDPGEYLAELSRFGSISNIHLQRHAIDMSLGRYSKALDKLVAAGPMHFEAALKLARERGLLRQLLALTQQQQQQQPADGSVADSSCGVLSPKQRLVAVLSAHGDALMAARKTEDAAVAYSAAGLMEQALGAYRYALVACTQPLIFSCYLSLHCQVGLLAYFVPSPLLPFGFHCRLPGNNPFHQPLCVAPLLADNLQGRWCLAHVHGVGSSAAVLAPAAARACTRAGRAAAGIWCRC